MKGLRLETIGHATIVLYRDGESPLLVTDPWLVGSVYWRSWWLRHYPSAAEIEWLADTAHVYVTHEHPDHFHTPSIRRLGARPAYLFPALAERGWLAYLAERGYRAAALPPRRWHALGTGVAIMSIPLWNDDSLLLIDTPNALILNLNDAKPLPPVLRALRRLGDRIGKPRVLLASYSPASLVNSFLDERGVVSLRSREHYVAFICRLCERLGADFYIPFASQAVFERADSAWANPHRTEFADLEHGWNAPARLLPPYTNLNLGDFSHRATAPEDYRPAAPATRAALTAERFAAETDARVDDDDVARLERKLNAWRWLLWPLFPRGFSFRLGERQLFYRPRRGRIGEGGPDRVGDFEIAVPALTIKEALRNDHLSDLGITMFVRIRLMRRIDPRKVYALFVLFQFDDYGHLRGPGAVLRWLWGGLRDLWPRRLRLPPAQAPGPVSASATDAHPSEHRPLEDRAPRSAGRPGGSR